MKITIEFPCVFTNGEEGSIFFETSSSTIEKIGNPIVTVLLDEILDNAISDTANKLIKGGVTKKCVTCNKEFTITPGEKNWFVSADMDLPKRCNECRDARKKKKEVQTQTQKNIECEENSDG